MRTRVLVMIGLVLMIALVIGMGTYFSTHLPISSAATTLLSTSTPTPEPTPTPTPDPPTPTPTPIPSPTQPPLFTGNSVYLLDATSGKTLLDVNSHARLPMWSTTKMMTALLAIERLAPDQIVTVQQQEIDEVPTGMSIAFLHVSDHLSIEHLLYALMLPSGSDAAVVLAHAVSGDTPDFVALMNARATQLGLTDTHYANPYGAADPNNYSSSADLVKLARVAMGYPLFAQIVATEVYHLGGNLSHVTYDWNNITLSFLQNYPGANGIKTGSDDAENDWCMVFSAYRNGRLLIGAEMQASSQDQVFTDATNILNKGFSS
jgi:D-alanyl-D-alanine carboxypeptidase (penicillin-binding protein 5/6)